VTVLGIVRNPYNTNVPDRLLGAAAKLNIPVRTIDMASLSVSIDSDGGASVADKDGTVEVDSVSPYLLFGYPAAIHALRILSWNARMQNPLDSVLLADDKAGRAPRERRRGPGPHRDLSP
jgi:hypothetical protein